MEKVTLGILAHVDAGKTTLSEALLYKTGAIRSLGRVDHKDAYLDNNQMERDRGITIFSKIARFSHENREYILLDTPGHSDFTAEMERTLSVLDFAILVISGLDGVQGHTKTLWRLLSDYGIPCFIFVNKMDISHKSPEELLADLQEKLSENCYDFDFLTRENTAEADLDSMEKIALSSEELMEYFLETGNLDQKLLARAVSNREVFPVIFGSALLTDGVENLLSLLHDYALFPKEEERADKKFAARCFKIGRDSRGERLSYIKILSGKLAIKDAITYQGIPQDKPAEDEGEETTLGGADILTEKINQIRICNGEKYTTVEEAGAGQICLVTGLSQSYAGMPLGCAKGLTQKPTEPVLSYHVIPPEGCMPQTLLGYMRQIEEEDPTLKVTWQERDRQVHVHLMGPVQTEVLQQMLKERFGILVTFGPGKVKYKETIRGAVEGVGHFEPLRHYAEAHVLIEALPQGSGMEYAMDCPQDVLDLNWQRLIFTHLSEKTHRGVLTGSPLTDVRLTVVTGKAHTKHTEGGDFRQATYRAIRQGLRKAESVLLEPYYKVTIEMPAASLGKVMTDLNLLHGKFEAPMMEGDNALLQGIAPVCLMRDYGARLASATGGQGRMSLSLEGYFPCHNTDEVVSEIAYDPDRDVRNTCDSVFCGHGAGYSVPWYEVEDKMHMPMASYLYEKEKAPSEDDVIAAAKARAEAMRQGPKKAYDGYGGLESDLEEIFVREFGEIKRRLPATEKRVIDGEKEDRVKQARDDYKSSHAGSEKKPKERKKYFLVDGYNIIFAWPELSNIAKDSIDGARGRLLDIMCNFQGHIGQEMIVVFDAYRLKGHAEEVVDYHNIHVVYTKEAETADAFIERTSHEMQGKYDVTVATSDRREQMIVIGEGARRFSARDLEKEVERVNREAMEKLSFANAKGGFSSELKV